MLQSIQFKHKIAGVDTEDISDKDVASIITEEIVEIIIISIKEIQEGTITNTEEIMGDPTIPLTWTIEEISFLNMAELQLIFQWKLTPHRPITLQALMVKEQEEEQIEEQEEEQIEEQEEEQEEEQDEVLDLELGTNSQNKEETGIAKFARNMDITLYIVSSGNIFCEF